jgi:GTPase SAR1 family protein
MIRECHYRFNVVFAVEGKSDLLRQLTGIEAKGPLNYSLTRLVDGKTIDCNIIQLVDTDKYDIIGGPITEMILADVDGALLGYDINDLSTYVNVNAWLKALRNARPDIVIMLVGIKSDLLGRLGVVPTDMAKAYASIYVCVSLLSCLLFHYPFVIQ